MATSIIDGPLHTYGSMGKMPAGTYASDTSVLEYPGDAGPNLFYKGSGFMDPRLLYQKDRVQGGAGIVPGFFPGTQTTSIRQIPFALGATKIAAAALPATGVPMTLAAASAGVSINIPIRPFGNAFNGNAPVTAALALDMGFAFGTTTTGASSTTVTVADGTLFSVGMPLVIAGVGNAGNTAPLLCNVASIASATTITITPGALAAVTAAPIAMGDIWGGQTLSGAANPPQAAFPFVADGPSLFLDARQALARCLSFTGVASGSGGTVTVAGWDIYGQPMTDTITLAAGANVVYSLKCFKYIKSVTPNFTDTHNVSVGTGDVFGFAFKSSLWEETRVFWAGAPTTSTTGWTTADATSPATATTGDVRGTIQTGAAGAGSGIGSTASNGSVSALALTGNRLDMSQSFGVWSWLTATPSNASSLFGVTQV